MSERKSRRVFTKEFKEEIVGFITSEGRNASEVARDFDIHRSVCRWVKEFRDNGDSAFAGHGNLAPSDEEVRRLKKELAAVQEERDILKKALAFFSRRSK